MLNFMDLLLSYMVFNFPIPTQCKISPNIPTISFSSVSLFHMGASLSSESYYHPRVFHGGHYSRSSSQTIDFDTNWYASEGGKHQRDLQQWTMNNHISEPDTIPYPLALRFKFMPSLIWCSTFLFVHDVGLYLTLVLQQILTTHNLSISMAVSCFKLDWMLLPPFHLSI